MGPLEVVVVAIWIMLPAYLPNNVAVLVGGGPPIDAGVTLGNRRLLGDGKTWRGLVGGIAAGIILALVLNEVQPTVVDVLSLEVPTFSTVAIVSLPTGALLGDIAASFLKRRVGLQRGASLPGVDQFDLVIGSLGLTAIVAWSWLSAALSWWILLAIVIITPVLHVMTNGIAYLLGLKDVPW